MVRPVESKTDIYLQGRKMIIKDGKKTLFWVDTWLYEKPLSVLFPDLYKMAHQKDISVNKVMFNPQQVCFSRCLVGKWRLDWLSILKTLTNVQLGGEEDVTVWRLGGKGKFIFKSIYNTLAESDAGPYHKKVWEGKIPAKIKIFVQLILNNAVLTKDNLLKRNWAGDPTCYFCTNAKTVSHLFFQCSMAKAVWAITAKSLGALNVPRSIDHCWSWCELWLPHGKQFHTVGIAAKYWAIWKARNGICFEGKKRCDPVSILCHACALIKYWAGLYGEGDKDLLVAGVETMLKIAIQLLGKKTRTDDNLRIEDCDEDDQKT